MKHTFAQFTLIFIAIVFLNTMAVFAYEQFVKPTPIVLAPTTSSVTHAAAENAAPAETFLSRLKIPAIEVDAPFVGVGRTPGGAMEAPKLAPEVGWYRLGPKPGEVGNAVVAGHRGWDDGTAVFDHLHLLKVGDIVFAENEKGEALAFVVRELKVYAADASGHADDATAVFASADNGRHLNLITCEGDWDPASHSYTKRLVVFTDLIQ